MRTSQWTPWGMSDYEKEIAPGITWYSTSSHGGFHLSAERLAQMPEPFKSFKPFAGDEGWYEEDCDWAVVVVAFPEAFSQEERDIAERTISSSQNYFKFKLPQMANV